MVFKAVEELNLFHCALVQLDEIEFALTTNGSEFVIQLPIGFDDATEIRYSILAVLSPIPGYGDDGKEFIFCIVAYDAESDELHQIWDGLETRRIISDPQHRRAIIAATRQAARSLIDEAAPRVVSMHTHTANLPEKALTKYSYVAQTFVEAGYRVGTTDVWHGKHSWMMERQT